MSSPLVIIDDTSPSIQYSGPWFEFNGDTRIISLNIDISSGEPFNNTLHGVNVTANFSFLFSGTGVLVYGTTVTTNASGSQDPTWECFLDNTSIGWYPTYSDDENNWILCGGWPGQFQDGSHLLTVKVNVSNQQTFWFDQIQYAPSASVSLNQSLLRIDSTDPAIQYGSGWSYTGGDPGDPQAKNGNTSSTQINGTSLTYYFSGTSISWVGTVEPFNNDPSSPIDTSAALATCTIDGQEHPINVTLSLATDLFNNQILFTTPLLSLGQHTLVVTYFGNSDSTAQSLTLNYFVLWYETSSMTQNTSSTTVPSANSSNSSSISTSIDKTPIIGGVVGGLVLISLLLVLFFNHRRNNRRSQAPHVVNPFTVPYSNPNSTLLPQDYTSNGQSLLSQYFSSQFTQRDQPSDPSSTYRSGGIPPLLTQLRPQFSSKFIPPSSPLRHTGSRINFDSTMTRVPQAATITASTRSQCQSFTHEDSSVRIPLAEDDVVEFDIRLLT